MRESTTNTSLPSTASSPPNHSTTEEILKVVSLVLSDLGILYLGATLLNKCALPIESGDLIPVAICGAMQVLALLLASGFLNNNGWQYSFLFICFLGRTFGVVYYSVHLAGCSDFSTTFTGMLFILPCAERSIPRLVVMLVLSSLVFHSVVMVSSVDLRRTGFYGMSFLSRRSSSYTRRFRLVHGWFSVVCLCRTVGSPWGRGNCGLCRRYHSNILSAALARWAVIAPTAVPNSPS